MSDQEQRINEMAQGLVVVETNQKHARHDRERIEAESKQRDSELKAMLKEMGDNVITIEKAIIDGESSQKATLKTLLTLFSIIATVITCAGVLLSMQIN